jgi:hypothetical protein
MRLTLLLSVAWAVDDSTMSLLAKVDPIPASPAKAKASSLLQADGSSETSSIDSYIEVSGIQTRALAEEFKYTPSHPQVRGKILVAPRMHDAPENSETKEIVPEVLICYLPEGKNGLSVRTCDMIKKTPALLSQVLRCSDRVHPNTVADLMMGRQTAPIDLSQTAESASVSASNMETPVSVDVSFGPCDGDRSQLPDLDTSQDYLTLVLLNPDTERAAENFSLKPGAARAFRAGLVFVSIPKLFEDSNVNLKGTVAKGFTNGVGGCMADGVCTAAELVEWTKKGEKVDFLVGASNAVVRLSGGDRTTPVL